MSLRELNHRRIDFFRALKLKFMKLLFDRPNFTATQGKGILVFRLDDKIGDSISSTGFLREVKKANPSEKLIVVAGPTTAQVYENLPFVDSVAVSKKGLMNTLKCFSRLKDQSYKIIFNTSHILNPRTVFLVSRLKAAKKIGFGNFDYQLFSDYVKIEDHKDHVTDRYKKALAAAGIKAGNLNYEIKLSSEKESAAKELISNLKKQHRNIIVLNSFAGGKLRNLNQQTTVQIVKLLTKSPENLVLSPANTGDHRILNEWIQDAKIPNWQHLPHLNSLHDNMALVKFADLIVTPDTAYVHMASAFGKKLVAIFREDVNEFNSVNWAPYQTEFKMIFAKNGDVNNVDAEQIAEAVKQMLGPA